MTKILTKEDLQLINWIASYPKSGNTWVRLFISAYVFGKGEVDINKPTGTFWDDRPDNIYERLTPRPLEELTFFESMSLRPAVLIHMLNEFEHRECFVKTHNIYAHACGIDLIPTPLTKQAFYIIRDPRSVAVSYSHHNGISIDDSIALMNNPQTVLFFNGSYHCLGSWSDHVQNWTEKATRDGLTVTAIKYEDMIDNVEAVFNVVRARLQVEIDEDLMKKCIKATSFRSLQKQEKDKKFKEKLRGTLFFRKGKPQEWRAVLEKEQIKAIQGNHGEIMQKLGYKLQ